MSPQSQRSGGLSTFPCMMSVPALRSKEVVIASGGGAVAKKKKKDCKRWIIQPRRAIWLSFFGYVENSFHGKTGESDPLRAPEEAVNVGGARQLRHGHTTRATRAHEQRHKLGTHIEINRSENLITSGVKNTCFRQSRKKSSQIISKRESCLIRWRILLCLKDSLLSC